ncbi:MAG: murein biosynthesis integral membrane protein MurJ [bacterium]
MVKKFLNFFQKEIGGLHEAAYLLGFFALLSQLLALVRDRLLASIFGASHSLDLYYAAFRIPDFIFVTVASVVSISVLVPFLIEKMAVGKEEGKRFIDNVFSFFFLIIIAVSAIVYFLIPYLSPHVFSGFSDKDFPQLIHLTRMLLLSPILLGLSNFFGSITQVYKRFMIYSLSPLAYNFGIIIGAFFIYPYYGLNGLVLGVILGALMHFLIQIPFVFRQGLFPSVVWHIDFPGIKRVMLLSVPRTFTLGVSQLAIIFLIGMASFMKDGSISVFNFSFNLQSVPLSIIGVSYSIAAFPTLAKLFTAGESKKFMSEILESARHIIFWSLPITALFVVLRAQIVRTILGSGEFSWSNTRLTAAALAIFAISVVAQSLILLFVRGYYAMGNTKKPLIISSISGVLIIFFSYLFVKIFSLCPPFQYFIESLFKVSDIAGTSVLMLPLGYTLATLLNCFVLWYMFNRQFPGFTRCLSRTFFQSFSASVVMGFSAYVGLNIFDNFLNLNKVYGIFLQGLGAGIFGIVIGVIVLKLLGNKEIDEIWQTLHRKIWKVKPLPADVTEI